MNFNFLKNLLQTCWSTIKLSVKVTTIFYLKFNIRLTHFFIETKIGYSFFLFSTLYGLFGCSSAETCHVTHALATLLVLYIMSTVAELWFLVKIPFTRKILDQLLTKEYILKYMGEHSYTKAAFKTFLTVIGAVALESGTSHVEHIQNTANSRHPMDDYYKALEVKQEKPDFNAREYKDAIKERNFHLHKKAEGLFTKSVNSEQAKHLWSEISKTISGFGKR